MLLNKSLAADSSSAQTIRRCRALSLDRIPSELNNLLLLCRKAECMEGAALWCRRVRQIAPGGRPDASPTNFPRRNLHSYSRHKTECETVLDVPERACNCALRGAAPPGMRRWETSPCASFPRWCGHRKF